MQRPTFVRAFLFGLLFCSPPVLAQEIMSVNIQQRCVFSGGFMDEELYRFEESNRVAEWVQEICDLGKAPQNFRLVQTNVENVSAVLDSGTRYLFYSIDFVQKASRIQVYAALAHEIGHHANGHGFLETNRAREESEADFFMGYVLSKKNFTKKEIEALLRDMPSSYDVPPEKRLKTVLEGFEKASRALTLKSLAFDNDPRMEALLLPTFTFKTCYTYYNMSREVFADAKTLAKVDEKIRLVLDQRGYYNRSYFSVKNGFAIVSQMEQYNQNDGSIRNDRTRWIETPARDNFDGFFDMLASIVLPNNGHFRLFAFVVTNEAFTSSNKRVSKEEAAAWLGQGANRLPEALGERTFANDYVVSVLVYEFKVLESNWHASQICPTPKLPARVHLIKSGLGAGLGLTGKR